MTKWWNWVLVITLICLLFVAVPINYGKSKQMLLRPMFDDYIVKFNKTYKGNSEEYETRFQHFMASMEEIDRLNAESHGPEHLKARYGLTKISDMSKAEYRDIHLSDEKQTKAPHLFGKSWTEYKQTLQYRTRSRGHSSNSVYSRKRRAAVPLQVDWRSKGIIGPIKDQGLCGACWAFSTIGTVEAMAALQTGKLTPLSVQAMAALQTGKLTPLSVQEVVDCATLGNSGCLGGDICLLLDWLLLNSIPVETEKEYPLFLKDQACKLKKNAVGVKVSSFTCDSLVGAEDKILEAIATHGPVTVAVNALTWQNYLGGVIQYNCNGTPQELNHAVQLIGYDLTADVPYYIAKNSWGTEFGNGGYLNLAIGSNICGLANEVATVDVK